MSLSDVLKDAIQHLYPYDVKNTFFVNKDLFNNTKDNRKVKRRYHDNGKLKQETSYYMKDGKVVIHGLCCEWYSNGQLFRQRDFNNGLKHGLYKEWYPNGQLQIECAFEDDKRHGDYYEYYLSGNSYKKFTYKDDKRHGLCLIWYDKYEDEQILDVTCNYKNGELDEDYHEAQQILDVICNYKNGELHGYYCVYHKNGELFKQCNYIDGKLHGLYSE